MSIEKNKPEQIVTVPRQIEVQIATGRRCPKPAKKPESTPRPTIAGGRSTED